MTSNLSEQNQARLLSIARRAIEDRFSSTQRMSGAHTFEEHWLNQPAAAFVTIRRGERLHGCIGTVERTRPLGSLVARNAVLAAFEDPRSKPVRAEDLHHIRLEISVLGEPENVPGASEQEILAQVRPFVDGLILSRGGYRGVFLPQVWKNLTEPVEFFNALKEKAGLATDAFARGETPTVKRFEVQKFCEAGYAEGDD